MTFSRRSARSEDEVAERGITLNFTSGARVALLEEEATWLRDELLGGEAAIIEACQNLKAYLETALTFDGREELHEF